MNISIKLKHTQLTSLVNLLENIISTEDCRSRQDAIVTILMVKLYKKLKEKTVLLEPRNYTFSVAPETAMAFVEFFSLIPFDITSYGGNITRVLIDEFDKQTSNLY